MSTVKEDPSRATEQSVDSPKRKISRFSNANDHLYRYVTAEGVVLGLGGHVIQGEKLFVPDVPKKKPAGEDFRPKFQCKYCREFFIHLRAHERNGYAGRNSCKMQPPVAKPESPKNPWKTDLDAKTLSTHGSSADETCCSAYDRAQQRKAMASFLDEADKAKKSVLFRTKYSALITPSKDEKKAQINDWVQKTDRNSHKRLFH